MSTLDAQVKCIYSRRGVNDLPCSVCFLGQNFWRSLRVCVCVGGGGGGGGGGKHLLNGCQIDVLLILSEQNMLLQTV